MREEGDRLAIAWIDISTGEFRLTATDAGRLAADLARIDAREVILPETLFADPAWADLWRGFGPAATPLPAGFFDGATAEGRLAAYFGVTTLDGFGSFGRIELAAAALALAYVEKNADQRSAAAVTAGPREQRRGDADRSAGPAPTWSSS